MDDVVKGLVEVCLVDELAPGQKKIVDVDNRSIGIFNVAGQFYALANRCPHAGGELCRGEVTGTSSAEQPYAITWHRAGEIVRCPWHSWEFDIATGNTITEPKRSVRTYKTVIKKGRVYIESGVSR